jgi:ribosomal protein L37AE/L43A
MAESKASSTAIADLLTTGPAGRYGASGTPELAKRVSAIL